MDKIILINTSFYEHHIGAYSKLSPPLGLLSIASPLLKSGFEVKLIDPQIETDYLKRLEREIEHSTLFVGMTTFMGTNIINALEISHWIKERADQIPIVWGGPLATSSPSICFRDSPVDYIAMGMGEKTVVDLAKALNKNGNALSVPHVSSHIAEEMILKEVYCFTGNLDDIDYPELRLWDDGIKKMGVIPILSSRGCPRNCAFCYNNTFIGRKKWYPRSEENVINEMEHWHSSYGINEFYFVDDNFLVNTKRACNILKESLKRGFKFDRMGGHLNDYKPELLEYIIGFIRQVGFSIESASPRIQKLINKKIDLDKALDLFGYFSINNVEEITTNFMFGFPKETLDDIQANIETAYRIREINNRIRIIPFIYSAQPKDDIIPNFPEVREEIEFTLENLSTVDLAPNRSNYLSADTRPWMNEDDIRFYLDLILVWFYHFDYKVRASQEIDIESICEKNQKLAKLFQNVPMP